MLLCRPKEYLGLSGGLNDNQFGFRMGSSTKEAMRRALGTHRNLTTHQCFIQSDQQFKNACETYIQTDR